MANQHAPLTGIELIIWDLDGALVDTLPDLVASFRAAARAVGFGELTDEQTQNKVGGGARKALEKIFGPDNQHLVDPGLEFFKEYYPKHSADYSALYPGIAEVLQHFAGKVKMAMVTAKIRPAAMEILKALKVDQYFEYVVGAEDMTRMKPDPQGVQLVLEKLGIAAENAVMIGDMKTDVQAAHSAGAKAIGVSYGYGNLADIQAVEPEFIIDQASELLDIINPT